jgi:uncharacterized protein RhaS with RHS repeats
VYDPMVGRFLEEDPIGFAAGDPNLFRYVRNSPTNATDPSGLQEAVPQLSIKTLVDKPLVGINGSVYWPVEFKLSKKALAVGGLSKK